MSKVLKCGIQQIGITPISNLSDLVIQTVFVFSPRNDDRIVVPTRTLGTDKIGIQPRKQSVGRFANRRIRYNVIATLKVVVASMLPNIFEKRPALSKPNHRAAHSIFWKPLKRFLHRHALHRFYPLQASFAMDLEASQLGPPSHCHKTGKRIMKIRSALKLLMKR